MAVMTPIVTGKSRKPRCFINVKTMPLCYEANSKAWMTATIFIEWPQKMDNEMKKQNHKILLFMNQCIAHPQDTNI